MKCPRCSHDIDPVSNSCPNCGLILVNSAEQGNKQVIKKDNDGKPQVIQAKGGPVNLEGYFVGKNYAKIKKHFFSWPTLIFGFLYTLYRKMLLISLVWIAIDVASVVIMGKYSIFIIVGLNIVMSFLVNYIYLAIVDNKVNNIKRKYWGHSIDELKYRCSRKGGTSRLPLFFFWFAIMASLLIAFLLYMAFYPKYRVGNLYFRIGSDFKPVAGADQTYATFQYSDTFNFCEIGTNIISDYGSMDQYIEKTTANFDKNLVKISTVNRWGRNWKLVDATLTETSRYYIYLTEKDNKLYQYAYRIHNGYGGKCDEYYKYVKYSMTVG